MVDFPVDPQKLALLNVDLQNVFVEATPASAPDGLEVVGRVNSSPPRAAKRAFWSSTLLMSHEPMARTWGDGSADSSRRRARRALAPATDSKIMRSSLQMRSCMIDA